MTRLILLAFCSMLLTACGLAPADPHSQYFIVTFGSGTQDPTDQGRVALDNALKAADGAGAITISGMAPPADAAAAELLWRRAEVIAQILVKAGIDEHVIRRDIRSVDDATFAKSKDALTLQLAFDLRSAEPSEEPPAEAAPAPTPAPDTGSAPTSGPDNLPAP